MSTPRTRPATNADTRGTDNMRVVAPGGYTVHGATEKESKWLKFQIAATVTLFVIGLVAAACFIDPDRAEPYQSYSEVGK